MAANGNGTFVKSCLVEQVRHRVSGGNVEANQLRREGLDLPNLVLREFHLARYSAKIMWGCHICFSERTSSSTLSKGTRTPWGKVDYRTAGK